MSIAVGELALYASAALGWAAGLVLLRELALAAEVRLARSSDLFRLVQQVGRERGILPRCDRISVVDGEFCGISGLHHEHVSCLRHT